MEQAQHTPFLGRVLRSTPNPHPYWHMPASPLRDEVIFPPQTHRWLGAARETLFLRLLLSVWLLLSGCSLSLPPPWQDVTVVTSSGS